MNYGNSPNSWTESRRVFIEFVDPMTPKRGYTVLRLYWTLWGRSFFDLSLLGNQTGRYPTILEKRNRGSAPSIIRFSVFSTHRPFKNMLKGA